MGLHVSQRPGEPTEGAAGPSTKRGGTHGSLRRWGNARPPTHLPAAGRFNVDAGQTVQAGTPRDQVEISPLGQMLDGISRLPEIRHEKVEEIRRQIATGSYETPAKLELALDRLLDELRGW